MRFLSLAARRPVAALRALWDMLWGSSAPLAGSTDLAREQFDSAYDALLAETAASLEPSPAAVKRGLRLVA
jgi:hypothetical protein